MQGAGGLPSQEVGGRRVLVWEQLGAELMAWVLMNTGFVPVNKTTKLSLY